MEKIFGAFLHMPWVINIPRFSSVNVMVLTFSDFPSMLHSNNLSNFNQSISGATVTGQSQLPTPVSTGLHLSGNN